MARLVRVPGHTQGRVDGRLAELPVAVWRWSLCLLLWRIRLLLCVLWDDRPQDRLRCHQARRLIVRGGPHAVIPDSRVFEEKLVQETGLQVAA